jgi:hypothetical protein
VVKLLVPALVGMLGLLAVHPQGARADTRTLLPPLPGFHQMLVDQPAGYVFLSEGTGAEELTRYGPIPYDASGVVVTTLSGKYVTTLDAGNGVEGLALSADGNILYAALSARGAVAAIDVASITPTTTLPTQELWQVGIKVPFDLAIQSSKLWVSFNPSQAEPPGYAQIGYFNLSVANPSFVVPSAIHDVWYDGPPELAADPSNTGILIAAQEQQDPAVAASYNVSGSTVITLAAEQQLRRNGSSNCANEEDLSVVPGGGEVIMACGAPYAHYYYSTADLSLLGDYATGTSYPNSIAMAPSAGIVALGDSLTASIYVYKIGGTKPLSVYNFGLDPTDTVTLANRGLALSPDGSVLYAVTEIKAGYSLNIFDHPTAGLTMIGPPTGVADTSLSLNGSLNLPAGTPAGTQVKITRAEAGQKVTLPPATTAADGSFIASDTPPLAGTYTYTASYGGRTASTRVNVARMKSKILINGPSAISTHSTLTLNGFLFFGGPGPAGITVTITRTEAGQTVTLPSATTGYDGAFTLRDRLKSAGSYTYTFRFAGDAAHAPAKASFTVTAS